MTYSVLKVPLNPNQPTSWLVDWDLTALLAQIRSYRA